MRARLPRAVLVAAVAAPALGGVAYGASCPRHDVAAAGDPPSVLIVMDASRSMATPAGDGGSRLDAAKASLRALVDGLPDDARVGLRLYGHRVSGAGRARGCRDTELVAPVGRLDRAALKARIDGYRAVGSTPIGRALRAAAGDLPATGPASIVLVSDGGDNCAPPDPCKVAAQVAAAGRDVSIQTIGFQVGGRARAQLRCIAARGGGVYRSAENSDELAVALRALSARAMRTFRPEGRPVGGGSSPRTATPIGAGHYSDAVAPGAERWFAITLRRGQRLAATAVVVSPCPVDHGVADMIGTALSLAVFDPDGIREQYAGQANLFFGDESAEGTGLVTEAIGPKRDLVQSFARPGRYTLRVELSDNGLDRMREVFGAGPLPLELQTRVIGGDAPQAANVPAAADTRRVTRRAAPERDTRRLAPVGGAAVGLGLVAGLGLSALRRRGRR